MLGEDSAHPPLYPLPSRKGNIYNPLPWLEGEGFGSESYIYISFYLVNGNSTFCVINTRSLR